jgi:hypothetical protein
MTTCTTRFRKRHNNTKYQWKGDDDLSDWNDFAVGNVGESKGCDDVEVENKFDEIFQRV